jgi:purine-nucleoside phosphorylase
LSYADIPNVPGSAVEGHAGELVAGTVRGTPAIVLSGRAHPYEGFSHREATLLLRALLAFGPETVVLTNAAGGLNPDFEPGDVMLITDHINLSGDNPLLGPNLARFGTRFPPMTDAYDPELRRAALEAGGRIGVALREGVYIMLSGPSYETRAEMRMLRALGGDAVGMSTAHEAIVARHAGRRVLGFSLITNKATDDVEEGATHDEVIEMGRIGASRLVTLLGDLLPRLS